MASNRYDNATDPEALVPYAVPSTDGTKVYRTELTPLSFLRRSATVFPDRAAVVHADRGIAYSYRQFAERVNRLASALRTSGIHPGDRVAFLCPNIPPLLEAHFGVPAAGAILVAVNFRLTATEINAILDHAGARFLFVDRDLTALVTRDNHRSKVIRIDDTGRADDPYEEFLAGGSLMAAYAWPQNEEETISLSYT